jgi:hypothetical protein
LSEIRIQIPDVATGLVDDSAFIGKDFDRGAVRPL